MDFFFIFSIFLVFLLNGNYFKFWWMVHKMVYTLNTVIGSEKKIEQRDDFLLVQFFISVKLIF